MSRTFNALSWWHKVGDSVQQALADKYYPEDDFMVTNTNPNRIGNIWEKEQNNL